MELSKTWNARIHRGRHGARLGALVLLVTLAMLGGAAGIKVFLAPDRPDITAISRAVGNQHDQVGAFASDFVVAWLTATTTCPQQTPPSDGGCRDVDRVTLQRFLTLPESASPTLPTTPAAVVTNAQVVSVLDSGTVGDADLYAAVVAVDERPYPSATPTHAFYRVPISMWHYQTRALALPARINGPGPGADIALGYRHALNTASPVFAVVNGFIGTYLCSTTGLDRYVVAGTPLAAVGGYQTAAVSGAGTAEPLTDDPPPGTVIHVLATVSAQTAQYATVTMSYPLSVENSGGTWMVAAIDSMPRPDSDTVAAATSTAPN